MGAARDATRVAEATGDAPAVFRAMHWVGALCEHGALLGWKEETADDEAGAADGADADADAHAAADADAEAEADVRVGDDGNLDSCAVCGQEGLLVCCEACPAAFHPDCLPPHLAPADDDDADWYCPTCREALGMA